MTTNAQHDTRVPPATPRLEALRGNCMGAAVLLIVQFGLGIGVNLYVTLPAHKSFLSTVFGSAVLAVHAIVALALLGAAIAAPVRAIRARRVVVFTALGLAAIVAAVIAGHRSSATRPPAPRSPWPWPPRWPCSATWPRSSASADGPSSGPVTA